MDMSKIKFDSAGLVPAIAQDDRTGEVLMLAYMNAESIEKTLASGSVHYYSRSRQSLWKKGETSGNTQELKALYYDCDMDTLLLKIDQKGVACHTGERSCFYRSVELEGELANVAQGGGGSCTPQIITDLFEVIKSRKGADPESSYVAYLFDKGFDLIKEKIKEESIELVDAARWGEHKDVVHESADLWFHSMVLMADKGVDIIEIFAEFDRRFGTSGIEEKKNRTIKKG